MNDDKKRYLTLMNQLNANKPGGGVPVPKITPRPQAPAPVNPVDKGLNEGKSWESIAKENSLPLQQVKEYSQKTRPNYGITALEKPRQSLFNKVRDTFDANTEADKYRRFQGNIANANDPTKLKEVTLAKPKNFITQTLGDAPEYVGRGLGIGSNSNRQANESSLNRQRENANAVLNARKKLEDPRLTPKQRELWAKYYVQISNEANFYNQKLSEDLNQQVAQTDPIKGATAVGVMGLDAVSAGLVGTSGRQIIQQGIKAGLKSQAPVIATNALVNTTGGAGSGYVQGLDAKGIASSAAIAGTLGTIFDVGLATGSGLLGFARRGVKTNKLLAEIAGENNPEIIENGLRATLPEASEVEIKKLSSELAEASTIEEVRAVVDAFKKAPQATPTPQPVSTTISDDVITAITSVKKPEQIRDAVKALFPNFDDNTIVQLSRQLAETTDNNSIRQILEEAQVRSNTLKEATQQATPTGEEVIPASQGAQNQADLEQLATEQPIQTTSVADEAIDAPTTTAVQGATTADNVPGATNVDTLQQGVDANIAARASDEGLLTRGYKAVKRELFDPKQELQRLDDRRFKGKGTKLKDAPPEETLIWLNRQVENSPQQAEGLAKAKTRTGESLVNVMNRYKGEDENIFMQYLQQKHALDILKESDGKLWKVQDATPEQVQASIVGYEKANPQAVKDGGTVKAWADSLIDAGIEAGEITKEFGEMIKAKYPNYVPLSKVFSEDLVRPQIKGGMGNSVAKQNAVRFLGEGNTLYEDSFASLINRGNEVVKKANYNKFNKELLRRAMDGDESVELIVDPVISKQKREVVEKLKELRDVIVEAKKGRNQLTTKKRISKEQLKAAQGEAAEKARAYYVGQSVDGNTAWTNKLSKDELLDMFNVLIETNEIKAKTLANRLTKKANASESAANDLLNARANVNALQGEASELYATARALQQNIPTDANIIKGFADGEQFALRANGGLARQMEYLNTLRDDPLGRVSSSVAAPFKTLYTGGLAPAFAAKQVIRNQGLKFTNANALSAFGARPMTTGYFGGLTGMGDFYKGLKEYGYNPPVGTKVAKTPEMTAKALASTSDIYSRLKYKATRPREWWNTINKLAGKLDDADRVQIAKGEYLRRKRMGYTEEQSMAFAARQAQEALGDFQRVSKTAKRLEAFLPYSGATQAGHRALMRRFRTNPVETSVKVVGLMGAIAGAAYAGAQQFKEYYDEMIETDRTYDLDSNIILFTPGTHRISKEEAEASGGALVEGEWQGIIKIPVAPDYNPLTRASWRTGYNQANGEPADIAMLANEAKNFLTADQQNNIYQMDGRDTTLARIAPSSPVKNTTMVLAGVDPRSGQPLADDRLRVKPSTQQYKSYTTENAKKLSEAWGGILSPLQIDAMATQAGFFGDVVQTAGTDKLDLLKPFKNIVTGSKGEKEGAKYYSDIEEVSKTFNDDKQWELWQAMKTSRTNSKGEKTDAGMLDSAQKSLTLLSNEEVLNAEMEMNRRTAERSGNSNPILDDSLTPEQRNKVLTYRSMRINNAAKQNYTKNGESAFVSLGLDEQWYQDFKKKEDEYWKKVLDTPSENDTFKTFSGAVSPEATPELQAKMDYYNTLPKGTGDRSRFLRANQDVLDFWASQNEFTNEERIALGFKPIGEEDGSGSGFAYGSGGGSGSKEDETPRQYLGTLLAGVKPSQIGSQPNIDFTPTRSKFRVKTPSGRGRNFRRIKLN